MQRWQLSWILVVAATVAALLAPQLEPRHSASSSQPTPPAASLPRAATTRAPLDLAVVLDASGSMSAPGKFDLAKDVAEHLAGMLGPDDTYSLIVFADRPRIVVQTMRPPASAGVARALTDVFEGGGTNLYAGLERGVRLLDAAANPGRNAQIILLTEGEPNAGVVGADTFVDFAATISERGIRVSTLGFGAEHNHMLLRAIASQGQGTYAAATDPMPLSTLLPATGTDTSSRNGRESGYSLDQGR